MSNYNICVECNKEFGGRKKKYCSDECFKEKRRRDNRERMRKTNPPKPDVLMMCEWCGRGYSVPPRTAHQARFCSDECKDIWWSREVYKHKPIEERNKERKKQKLIRLKRLEEEREIAYLNRLTIKRCEWCDKSFETDIPSQVTCSSECRRKRRNRFASIRSDKRINDSNLVDKDITLERLYERDKGICHLCNERCDYKDKTITEEGHFIASETYPSIDHVIPLAKGGMHSWNNIKLAHHRCNTIKSDRIIRENMTLV